MSYIEKFEQELRKLLKEGDTEHIIYWAKERILESYRNGQAQPKIGRTPLAALQKSAEPPPLQSIQVPSWTW